MGSPGAVGCGWAQESAGERGLVRECASVCKCAGLCGSVQECTGVYGSILTF